MYSLIHELLSDKQGGLIFRCFDLSHFCYLLVFFGIALWMGFRLRSKEEDARKRAIAASITFAFALYILDFFLMPFAYEEIHVEKLPFHACTAMCVMSFWSNHNTFLSKFRTSFALLAFVSNTVYLCYPAGIMWHEIHPLSYRAVQTLSFHGAMAIYGVLVLLYDNSSTARRWSKNLLVVLAMTLWATIGNLLYTDFTNQYNWFFLRQDPFNLFPAQISPWIMPFLNIFLFLLVEYGVVVLFDWIKASIPRKQSQ